MQITSELTERELEILRMLATGASNKEIARHLFISSNTVKVHLRNTFAKIGVTSRTEAAVYAIRQGLSPGADLPAAVPATQENPTSPPISLEAQSKPHFLWIAALVTVMLVGVVSFVVTRYQTPTGAIASPEPVAPPRWQELAAMPTARSGLAVASQENQIYVIGGETEAGVTSVVERYDLVTDTWSGLSSKPTAVADVSAAVVGGRIYVPGGRLTSGEVTNILEIYDPREDRWEQGATLPIALSAYALVTFEGKLYLFGGWDGEHFLASVYEYDPDQDTWAARSPMSTARGNAGAATAGGRIYVIGGYDGKDALAVSEEYLPDRDTWSQRASLIDGRYAMGVASIVDIIYVIGGLGETDSTLLPLQYFYQQDQWQTFEDPLPQRWSYLGLVSLQTKLYGVGGRLNGMLAAQNLSYQAIYTILIPVIP
ncbi:MAG: LuxR C-terminal-related transcriptional regulator [Chloroflexi bacterium]|nr:LuxR C-terminal-related transcriptional regulator [Chloroflexota bacterium]